MPTISSINMKGLVQHMPTNYDISNLLKEFTVDFLLKGYNYLVEELHKQLLTSTVGRFADSLGISTDRVLFFHPKGSH